MRTPAENQQFVRDHWVRVWINTRTKEPRIDDTFFLTWDEAAEFTEQRLKDVRKVEMELALLRGLLFLLIAEPGDMTTPIWTRVLAREQAALDDLKKGMRP